jgi:HK97 family phage prohead protease
MADKPLSPPPSPLSAPTPAEERRFVSASAQRVTVETRADGKKVITGYAAAFYRAGDAGTEFELGDNMVERIMPGTFDRAISERQDVRGLRNHNPDFLLGRTTSGTCRLFVDAKGLKYEIDVPETNAGKDTVEMIQRGDMTGSSFMFRAKRVTWVETDGLDVRQIEDVDLYDVGPVTFPAYEATTTGLRSAEGLRAEWGAWKRSLHCDDDAADVATRLALVRLDD